MASTSPSFCRSEASTKLWIWTSSWYPSGNGGRMGRSMSRAVRVSLVVGRPFALEEAAGKLARGRHPLAIIAGQREEIARPGAGRTPRPHSTTVSPYWTRQLPAACLASSPVSMERIPAPILRSTRTFNVCSYLPCGGRFWPDTDGERPTLGSAAGRTACACAEPIRRMHRQTGTGPNAAGTARRAAQAGAAAARATCGFPAAE